MVSKALLVGLQAKPEKIEEVATFLREALPLVEDEPGTTVWFAIRQSGTTFGIFDAFPDEQARQAHLAGKVAQALRARADELFARPPVIEQIDVLAAKLPK